MSRADESLLEHQREAVDSHSLPVFVVVSRVAGSFGLRTQIVPDSRVRTWRCECEFRAMQPLRDAPTRS